MSDKATLKLDWCSHAAAKYAVEHWHYSRTMPHQKLVKIGVWEHDEFKGVIVFGDSANQHLFAPYGLSYCDGAELVRIALREHQTPVSRLVRIALALLYQTCPRLRVVLSFADPEKAHVGIIYQASNWFYLGKTTASDEYIVRGKRFQGRALRGTRGTHPYRQMPARNVLEWARKVLDPQASIVHGSVKHRYLYPLDAAMRAQIAPLAQPYPKRATSILADASIDQIEESGAAPTVALATG